MRKWLASMSVSVKLLALTVSIASLGILAAAAMLLLVHQSMLRGEIERGFMTLVSSAAEYCVGPLVFDDHEGADDVLSKFQHDPDIVSATLLDANHDIVATYNGRGGPVPLPANLDTGIRTYPTYVLAVQPVVHQNRRIGTLVVAMSTASTRSKLARETALIVAMCLLLIAASGLAAARLQKHVTAPLLELASTMRGITRSGDFAARVQASTSDEVGTLYDGFNSMLAQIQAREQERDRSEARLRALLAALPDQVFVVDSEGSLREVVVRDRSRALADTGAIAGKKLRNVVPEDVAEELLATVQETLATGRSQRLEYTLETDSSTRSMEAVTSKVEPIAAEPSDPWVLIITRDVSERRELERRLSQASKMDAVGRLAGGVAHDFNNLLTGVVGYAELLRLSGTAQTQEYAEKILTASRRAGELVRQLLALSRPAAPSRQPTQILGLLEGVAGMLRHTVDPRIAIDVQAAPSLWVSADPAQLEAAVLNLAINGRDAIQEEGRLTLRGNAVELKDGQLGLDGAPLPPGSYVEVSVQDTGTGIEPALQSRIFEPFFTTKPPGKGTGLGLAAVYATVKGHGGAIRVESEVGRGTLVAMVLPSADARETRASVPSAGPASGIGHILVVDDEDFVREVSARFLRSMGYRVSEAIDGQDALEVFERESPGIDLVVLDLVMPRLNGGQVLEALRRRAPTLPVLLVSGHATGPQADEARKLANGFLQKPYRPTELGEQVQRLMAARPEARARQRA